MMMQGKGGGDPDRARTLVGESGDSFWSAASLVSTTTLSLPPAPAPSSTFTASSWSQSSTTSSAANVNFNSDFNALLSGRSQETVTDPRNWFSNAGNGQRTVNNAVNYYEK